MTDIVAADWGPRPTEPAEAAKTLAATMRVLCDLDATGLSAWYERGSAKPSID